MKPNIIGKMIQRPDCQEELSNAFKFIISQCGQTDNARDLKRRLDNSGHPKLKIHFDWLLSVNEKRLHVRQRVLGLIQTQVLIECK